MVQVATRQPEPAAGSDGRGRCCWRGKPLSAQLGSHHGFHVLCVPDSDAEYPPPVAERKPQSHYEAYAARGILKRSWVDKHTSRIPVPAARPPSSSL